MGTRGVVFWGRTRGGRYRTRTGRWGGLAGGLGRELFARGLDSRGFASCLFGAGHVVSSRQFQENNVFARSIQRVDRVMASSPDGSDSGPHHTISTHSNTNTNKQHHVWTWQRRQGLGQGRRQGSWSVIVRVLEHAELLTREVRPCQHLLPPPPPSNSATVRCFVTTSKASPSPPFAGSPAVAA